MRVLGSAVYAVLDLFYPPHCAVCEEPFGDGERAFLCRECDAKIERIDQSHLCRCGLPLPETLDLCPTCAQGERVLEQIRSFGWYEEREDPNHVLSALIKIFKYRGERALAALLVRYLDQAGQPLRPRVEQITFVPMYPKKERKRGFNQAELLAHELGKLWGLPVVRTLEKIKDTEPQASLPHEARRENIRGAFRLAKFTPCATILIVDDVCTSGATLSECARVLMESGIERVYGLTVARAAPKNIVHAEDA
ncbi:MAG: ComF family protein [Candidatus Bipolaricaulia bacterium]